MACQFVFLNGKRAGTSLRFMENSFWIGRDPRCAFALDPNVDLQVSGRHAEISQNEKGYQLKDASTNGTFLNGSLVKESLLKDGDLLELGPGGPKLRFTIIHRQDPGTIETPPVSAEGIQPPPARKLPSTAAIPQPEDIEELVAATNAMDRQAVLPPTAFGTNMAVPLTNISKPQHTTQNELIQVHVELTRLPGGERKTFNQPVIRFGRDPTADVSFDLHSDRLVSYHHAKIMVLSGKAVLFDVESTNGTLVNGEIISRRELAGGETIELGRGGPKLLVSMRSEILAVPISHRTQMARKGATVLGSQDELKNLSLGDAALLGEYPLHDQLSIGRDKQNSIVLDSMYISSQHAVVERQGREVYLRDLGSANGVFLGGERVGEAVVLPGTEFAIGPYLLKFSGTAILVFDTRTKTWVDAYDLCQTDPATNQNYLDHISLKIQPGEFVCILGPSGCGKSSLLRSLNGSQRAAQGSVRLNGIDFYLHYEQLKHQVGYVPQDDIIHPQLNIWRTLQHAAKLRLPVGTSKEKRDERIRDVLSVLELHDHRFTPITKLSGGQRKRVSIAVELLTDPAIIYLDEPTSGLDPNLEEKMMLLLKEMTLRGKTVVAVTHTLDNIHLADKITFLLDGKLVFFGNEEEARTFFKVDRLPDIYKRFDEHKKETHTLQKNFADSPTFEKHIGSQLSPLSSESHRTTQSLARRQRDRVSALQQCGVLSTRYLEIHTRDVRNLIIQLLQAPLVALFICLAVKTDQPERGPTSTLFLIMSLSALWFGCSNAARELTKEASIYARERMVNLRIIPYVASKFFVLQWICLLQVFSMLLIISLLRTGYTLTDPPPMCTRWGIQACSSLILGGVPGSFGLHLLNLYLTALNGIGLGLLISALAGNSDKATSLVPLILIPQVLFSGSFGLPKPDEAIKRGMGYTMSLNWSLDQAKRIAMCSIEQEKPKDNPGAGCTTCLHAYDPFKHIYLKSESQSTDGHCKAVLPMLSQMTEIPESLQVVEDGFYTPRQTHGRGAARDAHQAFHGFLVLGGMTALFFALVCIAVKWKDKQHG